jgi:hypothetical protein
VKLSKDGDNLLLRCITKNNDMVNARDFSEQKENIDKAAASDGRKTEYFDFHFSLTAPSKKALEMENSYKLWDKPPSMAFSNKKLKLRIDNAQTDLERSYVDEQNKISVFNARVASMLMSQLDPQTFGFNSANAAERKLFVEFWQGMRISSWDLYMPFFTPLSLEHPNLATENSMSVLFEFLTLKTVVGNELGTHTDLLDINKNPGQVYRLACEDCHLRTSYFNTDFQTIEAFKIQDPPRNPNCRDITRRAREARQKGVKIP